MTPVLRVLAILALAVSSAACGAAPVRPDSQLMAGWVPAELDLGEASVQLEHPAGWRTKSGKKPEAFAAGDMRIQTPSPGGPILNVTVIAVPKTFPTAPAQIDQKVEEMIVGMATEISKRKPPPSEIMRVDAIHGGTYKVVKLDDATVPANSTDPDKFKYMTIGVLARNGWIVNFTVLHHEEAPPLGEEVLGVVRTVRVVPKTATSPPPPPATH